MTILQLIVISINYMLTFICYRYTILDLKNRLHDVYFLADWYNYMIIADMTCIQSLLHVTLNIYVTVNLHKMSFYKISGNAV